MYSVGAEDTCWVMRCYDTVRLNALAVVAPLGLVQVCVLKHDLQRARRAGFL